MYTLEKAILYENKLKTPQAILLNKITTSLNPCIKSHYLLRSGIYSTVK